MSSVSSSSAAVMMTINVLPGTGPALTGSSSPGPGVPPPPPPRPQPQTTTTGVGAATTTMANLTSIMSKVKAQVMTRDDSTGGWVPISGGGLSSVMLIKRTVQSSLSTASDGTIATSLVSNTALDATDHSSTLGSLSGHGDLSVCSPLTTRNEYLIVGTRISDQNVVLYCSIKRDFVYNKVMPTFHHWLTGNIKFGLTFVTATEGRQFDKAIKDAINDLLLDGCLVPSLDMAENDEEEDIFMTLELPVEGSGSRSSSSSSTLSSNNNSTNGTNSKRGVPVPAVPSSLASSEANFHRLHYVKDPNWNSSSSSPRLKSKGSKEDLEKQLDKIEMISDYVQFAKPPANCSTGGGHNMTQVHPVDSYSTDYSYPSMLALTSISGTGQNGGVAMGALPASGKCTKADKLRASIQLPKRRNRRTRFFGSKSGAGGAGGDGQAYSYQQCRHCLEFYNPSGPPLGMSAPVSTTVTDANGSRTKSGQCHPRTFEECEYAPDTLMTCINTLSCIGCAHCVLYHCVDKDEEDVGPTTGPTSNVLDDSLCCGGPSCSPPTPHHPHYRDQKRRCKKRWTVLTILSFFVPCLWCYPPLKAVHRAAKSRKCCFSWPCCCCLPGCVGGRHEPLS